VTPALMPRHERAAQFLTRQEEATPPLLRREMLQAGLIDDRTWQRLRQLMTRGVYEELT
jgi:hypothetical protein